MGTKHVHTDWVANMFWTTGWSAQPLEASVEVWCEASYYNGKGKDGDSPFEQKVLKTESSLAYEFRCALQDSDGVGFFLFIYAIFTIWASFSDQMALSSLHAWSLRSLSFWSSPWSFWAGHECYTISWIPLQEPDTIRLPLI